MIVLLFNCYYLRVCRTIVFVRLRNNNPLAVKCFKFDPSVSVLHIEISTWCQKWFFMAILRLQPPALFNFKTPDDWPRWRRRFEQFREASGLSEESDVKQVSALLYCMGESAEDVLTSTTFSEQDRKKYKSVIDQFDGFFKVQKNVIF